MLLLSFLAPIQPWREALQAVLERVEPDVLILLNCCAVASSAAGAGSGVTELIAVEQVSEGGKGKVCHDRLQLNNGGSELDAE